MAWPPRRSWASCEAPAAHCFWSTRARAPRWPPSTGSPHDSPVRGAPPPSAPCSAPTPVSWCTPVPAIRRPIMVHADGTTRLLDGARATPLGLSFDPSRPEHRETLPPRSTLLLYTDGLVERRREPLDTGIARAADLVQENRDTGLDDLGQPGHVPAGADRRLPRRRRPAAVPPARPARDRVSR